MFRHRAGDVVHEYIAKKVLLAALGAYIRLISVIVLVLALLGLVEPTPAMELQIASETVLLGGAIRIVKSNANG